MPKLRPGRVRRLPDHRCVVSAQDVIDRLQLAAQRGDGLTLDAADVADLDAELRSHYGPPPVPPRAGADRLTGGLLVDLGHTLQRHGYQRATDPAAMGNFALAVVQLARAFEGTAP